MDSEEIARRVSSMKISHNNTDDTIIIPAYLTYFGQQKLQLCLVAKVFSSKAVNRETFKVHMPRILKAKKTVKIEVIGENIFLLEFTSVVDRRQALNGGPWTFFKGLVVLQAPTDYSRLQIWFLMKFLFGSNVIISL